MNDHECMKSDTNISKIGYKFFIKFLVIKILNLLKEMDNIIIIIIVVKVKEEYLILLKKH
jgi:hypothetical protein